MLQNNPKFQYKSQKPALLQKFPKKVLNNTTVKQLGGGDEAIEVFPPEIFFKGKSPPKIQICPPFYSRFII